MLGNRAVVRVTVLVFAAFAASLVVASEPSPPPSPYAGQESRKIKALSSGDVLALEKGEGMGLAKAAELNRYPGPRHVLDLAKALDLNDTQREQTERIFSVMHKEAVQLGEHMLAVERTLDGAFRTGTITEAELVALTTTLGQLNGQLRATHLRAHLQLRAILTNQQVDRYQRMRGYGASVGSPSPDEGMHQHHHM